jgi:tRNA pseudouridine38-40 synthase
MRRLRLTLGYRGTRYAGWAVQSAARTRGRPTVQGTVESALERSLGHRTRVVAAGRTDAGVHADAQVVSFDTPSSITPVGLCRVLPRWLPEDVWVVEADEAASDFDARQSAALRWYRYAIWRDTAAPSSAWQGRCLVDPQALDLDAMRQASLTLLGRHDFAALATRPRAEGYTGRTVFAADWLQLSAALLIFEICADAYLKQMVRTIVGSLLWVGVARWTPEQFAAAMTSRDRRVAGPNAPAAGLSLHRVDY